MAEWDFIESHDLRAQDWFISGVWWKDPYYYVSGGSTAKVYRYDASWNYVGSNNVCSTPQDLFWNGTNWWVLTYTAVYKYDASWNEVANYSVSAQESIAAGLFWNGTNWHIIGRDSKKVFVYDASWNYTGTSYTLSDISTGTTGLFWNGDEWWVSEYGTKKAWKYNASFVYQNENHSVGQGQSPAGIHFDGTNWLIGVTDFLVCIYEGPGIVGTNMKINISDAWKDVSEIKINIGDAWKPVTKVQINIGDVWKTVFG